MRILHLGLVCSAGALLQFPNFNSLQFPKFDQLFVSQTRAPPPSPSVGAQLESLLGGDAGVDAAVFAAACASDVRYEDMASTTYEGPAAVEKFLAGKFTGGSRLVVERVAGDAASGGVTWRREKVGDGSVYGLRGTTFARLDAEGKIDYVREGSEPIVKPGPATEALLKAATANAEKKVVETTYAPRTPTTASGIAEYLWREAYPGGATPAVALELFAENIRYEDFNYPEPFLGKAAVKGFVEAFDIPGLAFVPLEISGGDQACCFCWKVTVNGNDGPQGISFYEVDGDGKVCYIRDIPACAPAPLGKLAALFNPALGVFTPRTKA